MRTLLKASAAAIAFSALAACSATNSVDATNPLQSQLDAAQQQIATLKSQATSAAGSLTSSSSSLLPPNAKTGHCYARVLTPATYKTEYTKVLVKGEGETVKVIPATFKHDNKKIEIKEASEKIIVVTPAKYENKSEKVLVRSAYQTWKKGRGPIEKLDASTGEIMCLVDVPAQYRTVTSRVLATPAVTKKVIIPAEYQEVHRHVIDQPAKVVKTTIPAKYSKVAKRVKVNDSALEWREILCETNTDATTIAKIQSALKAKGFNPGPIDGVIGSQTMSAVRSFQKSNELAVGQLTIATLKKLGTL